MSVQLELKVFNADGVFIPAIAETFTLREDHPDLPRFINKPSWRVTGYFKPWTPPKRREIGDPDATFEDVLQGILDKANREFPDSEGNKCRLQWCTREEAVYVIGTGVAGTHRLLSEIIPGPLVGWSPEYIAEEREGYKRLIGQVLF